MGAIGKAWVATVLLIALAALSSAAKPATAATQGKRILAALPMPSKSHNIFFTSLINGLLAKGHHVTQIAAVPVKHEHPNLRIVSVPNFLDILMNSTDTEPGKSSFDVLRVGFVGQQFLLWGLGQELTSAVLRMPEIIALKNEKYDLVITEPFFFQEPLLGFAHHNQVPSIALNPFGFNLWLNDLTGGAINPSYVPNVLLWMTDHMTFTERVLNTLYAIFELVGYYLFYYPQQNALLHEVFPDAPPLIDLIRNISLTMVNNQAALNYPVPLSPNVIEVGGLHIAPTVKPLPPELKKWMDASTDGVVYFSMGSNLKASDMPPEKIEHFLKAFGTLKQRVLIKWEVAIPANAPANCRFETWLPQQDVLAHPNTRVFVTHGGLLSTQESVHNGVPIVGIPIFGDQFMNMEVAVNKGLGVMVAYDALTLPALAAALDDVLHNPSYQEKTERMALLFKSQLAPPLEKALTYVDFLLKWGNADHLRPASLDLKWWQLILLDVFAAIFLGLYIFYRVIRGVFSLLAKCLCGSSTPTPTPAKAKKGAKRPKED